MKILGYIEDNYLNLNILYMFNFFNDPRNAGINALKYLMKNPLTVFLYSFFSKWYLLVALSALIVVFWVFSGLAKAGVLNKMEVIIQGAFKESKAVAQICVPKIADIKEFWNCIQTVRAEDYTPLTKKDLEEIKNLSLPNGVDDEELDNLINPYQDNSAEQ